MTSLVSSSNEHLLLKYFRIYGKIHYNYVEFTLEQKYCNNFGNKINAKYVFPIISDIQLSNLTILKDNKLSTLKVKESQASLNSYQNANISLENDFIIEKLQDTDIMTYDIINIKSNAEITISVSFACKTEELFSENYWKFKIPKILFPYNLIEAPHSAEFNIIRTDLCRQNSIILDNGNLITLEETHNKAIFQNFDSNNDIELIYYFKIPIAPFVLVQKDLRINRHAFHLSCPIDQELLEISKSGQIGEYIIFIDRGISMYDWNKAILEATALFIRSLPEDCYFNVISFGERFEWLFKTSRKYDKFSADEAIRTILQYEKHLGWPPNFFNPLQYVLKQRRIPGYPLKIFIISDGKFWGDTKEISNLVKEYENELRINIIGINTNEIFIQNLTKIGKGTSQLVYSVEQIKPAILGSLKQALVPAFTNIHVENYRLFDVVQPRDPFNKFIDEKIEISGVFKKGKLPKSIGILYQCEELRLNKEINVNINEDQIVYSSSMLVLEAKKCLNACTRQLAIEKSKVYQIEGDYTSFNLEKYTKNQPEDPITLNDEVTLASIIAIDTRISQKTTRSASNKTGLQLQTKRRRSEESKIVAPLKKAKICNAEAEPIEAASKDLISFSETSLPRNEVNCFNAGCEVEKIIHLQYTEGYWEYSESLSNIVNNFLDYNFDISNLNEKLITALVVALFYEKFEDYKCLWDLVIIKAKRWLAKNNQKLIKLSDF